MSDKPREIRPTDLPMHERGFLSWLLRMFPGRQMHGGRQEPTEVVYMSQISDPLNWDYGGSQAEGQE
jgi:hypothetical protein